MVTSEVRPLGPTAPFWSVEAGDDAVAALRVRRGPDGVLEILDHWVAPLKGGGAGGGARGDPAAAAALLRKRGLREHGIHLLLPGRGASCRSCRIAAEDADLPAREMERELFDLTPLEPDEAVLRWRRLGGAGFLDHRVVAERKSEVDRWREAFAGAGFHHLGLALAPAAALAALEIPGIGPKRGYLLEVRGSWSCLTAFEGPLSVRHPLPFGTRDIEAALSARGSGVSLDAALDAAPGSPAAAALAAAAAPLCEDLRRSVEYHRSAVPRNGEESLLPLGPAALRPGLRALLASALPVPLAELPDPGALQGVRLSHRARAEELRRDWPALLAPLAGALAAAGLLPRDLDFQSLPDDLPEPVERTLFPLAAAVLAAAVGASWVMAGGALSHLRLGRDAVAAIPAPAPARGSLSPAEAVVRGASLAALTEEARRRAALRRALTDLVDAFPAAESGGAADGSPPAGMPPFGAEGFQVLDEGGNYRVRIRLRPSSPGEGGGAPPPRMEPLVRSLEEKGWRITGSGNGVLTAEILHMKTPARGGARR